jgi:glucosylceramidase
VTNEQTRRAFLKLSAMGVAVTASADRSAAAVDPLSPAAPFAPPAGEIQVRVTGGKMRHESAPPVAWRPAGPTAAYAIELNPARKYQEMLGFGAAFTDAACYTFNRLEPSAREKLFHELFHPAEMGLSVCRTCMGASDYSTELFSYDEGDPDPEMKRFSIAHDRPYVLPMLGQARALNPELFLFSSPWSPPGWMKVGGSMLGGVMRQHAFAPYALYFVSFLKAYAAAGVAVEAVTVQNEVDTDQDGRMPACAWPQEYEMGFVKNYLGPALQKNGLATKIWILDHNYNLWGRAVAELEDEGVRKFASGVAFHGYVGSPDQMSKFHAACPDAHIYWTEGGPDITAPDYATDWARWGKTFTEVVRNWAEAVTGWNLALDEKGRPNIGPFPCGGVVTIHSETKEVTRSGQYWAFTHFSRQIRRGARRFDSAGTLEGIDHVAFENPDGKKVLILTNSGSSQTVQIRLADRVAEVALAADSLTTLSWS